MTNITTITPDEEKQIVEMLRASNPLAAKFLQSLKTKQGYYEAELNDGIEIRFELRVSPEG